MLDLEMREIHKVFFEESLEGLAVMESSLLQLGVAADHETINTIFRAAHSIKGGAATFEFDALARFAHAVESLLDAVRNAERASSPEIVQVLLDSVDCMRAMVQAIQLQVPVDEAHAQQLGRQITALLAGEAVASASQGWRIVFRPEPQMLQQRNEPARMFAELARLGPIHVRADVSRLPDFDAFDPEQCHLGWNLVLDGNVELARIQEVFDWVSESAQLEYRSQGLAGSDEITVASRDVQAPAVNDNAQPATKAQSAELGSIRVSTDRIDALMNLVGELVITQSMLSRFGENVDAEHLDNLQQGLQQLARNTRELQERVMQIRMLPISFSFNRFPRLIHEMSRKLGKQAQLKLSGESTEVDKTVLEKISDPLVHLVRNSLDHGIELPEARVAAGKSPVGTIELHAFQEGGNIIVEVRDDGAGLNRERILARARERGLIAPDQQVDEEQLHSFIFAPGFSTAEQVSDVSGRGVGMDVVKRNITDLSGHVQITSVAGRGSTVRIRLPLTLAILDGQLVRVGQEIYVVSLVAILETIQVSRERISAIAGRTELFRLRDEFVPVVRLHELFGIEPDSRSIEDGLLVVVESDGTRVGILVDDLLAQQQVVIKSLEANFRPVTGLAGATILGDGTVAPIIDVPGLLRAFTAAQRARVAVAA